MKKKVTRGALILAGLFLLIQVFPADRTNPPVTGDELREHLSVSPRVEALLTAACYDCHSNQTRWPWYGYVAPVSWLVSRDVSVGREHLNFSAWGTYDRRQQIGRLGALVDEVGEGSMPLGIYVAMHAEAELSSADRDSLVAWASAMRELLIDQDRAEKASQHPTR